MLAPLPLPNRTFAHLTGLALTPHLEGTNQVSSAHLRLGNVVLTAPDGATLAKLVPTIRTAVIHPNGTAVAVAPIVDLGTEMLDLPLSGAEIIVALVNDASPVAGCRPAYGVTTPLMVTELGGCRDLTTGLVWSMPPAQKLTWHQAVWGSELPANAQPDAFDGGRVNDYSGGVVPGGPDSSKTNYCHSLVEGGFKNWRMPTSAELGALAGPTRAGTYRPFDVSQYFLASTRFTSYAEMRKLSVTSSNLSYSQTNVVQRVLCVRNP